MPNQNGIFSGDCVYIHHYTYGSLIDENYDDSEEIIWRLYGICADGNPYGSFEAIGWKGSQKIIRDDFKYSEKYEIPKPK